MRILVALIAALFIASCTPPTQTVPGAVLSYSFAIPPPLDVYAVATAELAHVSTQVDLPPHGLVSLNRWGTSGNTIITARPVRYVIVLWGTYRDEEWLRFIVAHEAGHIALDMWGMPQSEELADLFALCYGSDEARAYALKAGVTGDCAAFTNTTTGHLRVSLPH